VEHYLIAIYNVEKFFFYLRAAYFLKIYDYLIFKFVK